MSGLRQDLRSSLRLLKRSPGYAVAMMLTLAIGVGSNTAAFSLIRTFLVRPLPFADAQRLVHIWATDLERGTSFMKVSIPNFLDWREASRSFVGLEAFTYRAHSLSGEGQPEQVEGSSITAGTLHLLGMRPILGHYFRPGDDRPGAARLALLGEPLWRRRFGGRRDIVGRVLRIDGQTYTVAGIMPAAFEFPLKTTEIWLPLVLDPAQAKRGDPKVQVFGRLRPGVTLQRAAAEMQALMARLRVAYPHDNAKVGVDTVPLREALLFAFNILRIILFGVQVAVGFLLLIVCANLANLSLARALTRTRDIALRKALGAQPRQLLRMFVAETLPIAALAGGLGLLLAFWEARALDGLIPAELYRSGRITVDWSAALFCLLATAGAGLLVGVLPALQLSRRPLVDHLKEGGPSVAAGRRSGRLRNALVVAQMAVALFLLIGASLVLESLLRVAKVDPGFDPHHRVTMEMTLPPAKFPTLPAMSAFYVRSLEQLRSLPGVMAVAFVDPLPLNFESDATRFTIKGLEQQPADRQRIAAAFHISPDYFQAIGMPLLQGRPFTAADGAAAAAVVIVNRRFADRFWPRGGALGQAIVVGSGASARPATVVGVVRDSQDGGLGAEIQPTIFIPLLQEPQYSLRLVAYAAGDPTAVVPLVLRELAHLDPDLAVTQIRTMQQVVARSLTLQRVAALLLGILAACALLLAVIGLYGLMSFVAAQRIHEIGVRMALGARRRDVQALILRQALRLALLGAAVGIAAGFVLALAMSRALYGIAAYDLVAPVGSAALLLLVAMSASLLPARRAMRLDPALALRREA